MRSTVYVGTSVDGFIARANHTVDFLDAADPIDDDMGFGDFLASVDAMVMGRNTCDFVLSSGHEWPYGDLPVHVVTSRPLPLPDDFAGVVTPTDLGPRAHAEQLAGQGHEHLYVDGGLTVRSWLAEGLIDDLVITQVPVLVGDGIPLFGTIPADISLRHVDTVAYANGCVQSHWRIERDPDGRPPAA